MDREKCKGCPYFKSYYRGMGVGSIELSYRCWWTGRDPANVKDEDCRRPGKEDSNDR